MSKGTKVSRRVAREKELRERTSLTGKSLLSDNKKTGASINLPISCCRPSKRCAATCYAMEGFVAAPNAIMATLRMDHVLRTGEGLDTLMVECAARKHVRICGIGDLAEDHLDSLLRLARFCRSTIFWGFTRKREIAEAINGQLQNLSLILSWDASHSLAHVDGYDGPLAFGPVQAGDEVPDDERIMVVFPEHHQAIASEEIKLHPKDCPATRDASIKKGACERCARCIFPVAKEAQR